MRRQSPLSLALLFLMSVETRWKRGKALRALHQLRSISHVIDMHQLTKNPQMLLAGVPATPSSPERVLTQAELVRYLGYCSELLALASKLAALHVQHLRDPVVLDAVNDVETLASGLSQKIWQKISVIELRLTQHSTLDAMCAAAPEFDPAAAATILGPPAEKRGG